MKQKLDDQSAQLCLVWDRVSDPVRRTERPLAFLVISQDRNLPLAYPAVLRLPFYESRPHRILANILHPRHQTLIRSQNMIEKLLLPNPAIALDWYQVSGRARTLYL